MGKCDEVLWQQVLKPPVHSRLQWECTLPRLVDRWNPRAPVWVLGIPRLDIEDTLNVTWDFWIKSYTWEQFICLCSRSILGEAFAGGVNRHAQRCSPSFDQTIIALLSSLLHPSKGGSDCTRRNPVTLCRLGKTEWKESVWIELP